MVANRRHGPGTQRYADGSSFEGTWEDDMTTGHGVLVGADGSRYEGGWIDNLMHGQGILTDANGFGYGQSAARERESVCGVDFVVYFFFWGGGQSGWGC